MYHFIPRGVCSREITYEIVNGKVHNIHFEGGCNGNGKGVAVLAEGHTPEELITLLENVKCSNKDTSCPAQLAKALEQALGTSEE